MKQLNTDIINDCDSIVKKEEEEDGQLRAQYGTNFNRPPSGTVNAAYKQQIFEFR